MTLRLDPAETEALRAWAERESRSMQDVAREAIREYVERHSRKARLRTRRLPHSRAQGGHARPLDRSQPCLVDGNKRLGLAALLAFLGVNGRRLHASNDAAYDLIVSIATGTADVDSIAAWLVHNSDAR